MKQKAINFIGIIFMFVGAAAVAIWCINVIKLTNCDFQSDYRCEIIHSLGVIIPPSAVVTVWFADDSQRPK